MLGAAERANTGNDGGVDVGAGAGHDPRGEGARVELVLGIQDQAGVHGADPLWGRPTAMQEVEEVTTDAVVIRFDVDAAAVMGEVIPVEQEGAAGGHDAVGDAAGALRGVVLFLRQRATQGGKAGAHDVHGMRRCRQGLENLANGERKAAERRQLGLVGGKLGGVGQHTMDEKESDLLELALLGDIEDVVAAIVQVVATVADGAKGGVPGGDAGEANAFLRFGRALGCGGGFGHRDPPRAARLGRCHVRS